MQFLLYEPRLNVRRQRSEKRPEALSILPALYHLVFYPAYDRCAKYRWVQRKGSTRQWCIWFDVVSASSLDCFGRIPHVKQRLCIPNTELQRNLVSSAMGQLGQWYCHAARNHQVSSGRTILPRGPQWRCSQFRWWCRLNPPRVKAAASTCRYVSYETCSVLDMPTTNRITMHWTLKCATK